MFPLAMGVVMALFGMSNGLYAAQRGPAPLNKKFFWAGELDQSSTFKQLKENELKRVAINRAMLSLLEQGGASVEELQAKLKLGENFTDKSIMLFKQLKKQKKIESPKLGSGYARVAPIFNELDSIRISMLFDVECAQRKVLDCKLKNASLSADTANKVSAVLKKIQKERLQLFFDFKIDANLQEETCTSYHMSAFPHMLLLDAQYHDLQKNILSCF